MTNRKLIFDGTPINKTVSLRLQFKTVWGTIRRTLLKDHGGVCMACGHTPEHTHEIEGHEVYSFPSNSVIRLERVMLLCRKCHHVVHLDRSVYQAGLGGREKASLLGLKGRRLEQAVKEAEETYRAEMVRHYCEVNGVSLEQCEGDLRQARPPKGWEIKPGKKATMDYGPYQKEVDCFLDRRYADGGQRWQRQQEEARIRNAERKKDLGEEDMAESEDMAEPFEMLPDHECPEDTAMWRDTFG
jgi:hypothetical protein